MNDLLPVGSVVNTTLSKRNFMIIGYFGFYNNNLYDYICTYTPTGLKTGKDGYKLNKDYFYINMTDIKDVLYIGYMDKSFDVYTKIFNIIKEDKTLFDDKDNILNNIKDLTIKVLKEVYNKDVELEEDVKNCFVIDDYNGDDNSDS